MPVLICHRPSFFKTRISALAAVYAFSVPSVFSVGNPELRFVFSAKPLFEYEKPPRNQGFSPCKGSENTVQTSQNRTWEIHAVFPRSCFYNRYTRSHIPPLAVCCGLRRSRSRIFLPCHSPKLPSKEACVGEIELSIYFLFSSDTDCNRGIFRWTE